MKLNITLLATLLCISTSMVFSQGSPEAIKKMHDRYYGKWRPALTFTQTTGFYKNDSLQRTETWYEHIVYTKNFRIDFGHPDSDKAVIYKNDSSFLFRNAVLVRARAEENELLFLLGGMYFYPLDTVLTKLNLYGYDLKKFHETKWNDQPVFVIGAANEEESVNQLWFGKENFNLVRMIRYENNNKQEAIFEDHVLLGGGYVETSIKFFVNDQLVQTEKYHDLDVNTNIPESIFDPYHFKKLKL